MGTDAVALEASVAAVAAPLADLVASGHELLVCHGNGPQVGMIHSRFAHSEGPDAPLLPLAEAVAMSQAYIGHHLQNALDDELSWRGVSRPVTTLVTRVRVDAEDPGFSKPTKPIGAFMSESEAMALEANGVRVVEDAGRGWRAVVASPQPLSILEEAAVRDLLRLGYVVIAGGGGGIAVLHQNGRLTPVDAVIDKDWVSLLLAVDCDCDILVLLTAVERVALDFMSGNPRWISQLSLDEARRLDAAGEFAEGSMKPKIEAAIDFVASKPGRRCLITSLDKLAEGLAGATGTWIEA